MDPMLKWIGGATAALVLLLGGATLVSHLRDAPEAENAPALEQAIPVDEAALTETPEGATDSEAEPAATGGDTPPTPAPSTKEQAFVVKRILPIEGPIKYGEWHWDDEGVPDGPLVVTVDLDARVVSIFRNGYEIGAAAAMLGTEEHPTPLGTFPIMSKERHNVSEKYGNAPMPWTLRLTHDGVAIHGGSVVENGYASHGCIAIPDELASRLFAVAKKGDKVIITRGETMQLGDSII
ncbi:L,D-transpeptidase family protein [Altererythrobacter sp. C41]|uniref:L,D-transpeptidase family protein n=1 Tax=Altererythrobacter sp. C41 TaxID=2806021 RepID=UPI00193313CE|nr:L,D-transpeptidase family protein [Altererythrobacter sp. C41]MBM0170510.1 L,D-transpeptidase family protein [Altererythrobacter sp. C41]